MHHIESDCKYILNKIIIKSVIVISNSGKNSCQISIRHMGNATKTEASDEVKDNRFRFAGYQYDEETGFFTINGPLL